MLKTKLTIIYVKKIEFLKMNYNSSETNFFKDINNLKKYTATYKDFQ